MGEAEGGKGERRNEEKEDPEMCIAGQKGVADHYTAPEPSFFILKSTQGSGPEGIDVLKDTEDNFHMSVRPSIRLAL